jgi:hypothetical protein
MDNPVKLATYGTQNEEKQSKHKSVGHPPRCASKHK